MGPGPPFIPPDAPAVDVFGRADVTVTTITGSEQPGNVDGLGYVARFDRPTGLAVNEQGDLYVADTGNNRIRLVRPTGETTTFAGLDGGFADGNAAQARFSTPCGVAIGPAGMIYVADTGNHRIRQIAKDGTTTTICGDGAGYADGPTSNARFSSPCSVTAGENGAIYVADTGNHCVREILSGQVTTLFGRTDHLLYNPHPYATPPSKHSQPEADKTGGPPAPRPPVQAAPTPSNAAIAPASDKNPGFPVGVQFQLGVFSNKGAPVLATTVPSSGTIVISGRPLYNIPIRSDQSLTPPQAASLRLNHPVAACAFAGGWLMTDERHGAVFLVRNGVAEVIAGRCNSLGMQTGLADGSGAAAFFGTLGGIATDGKRYVYVADTSNNSIRRLDISELLQR
jgi:hypothetical protein